MAYESLEECGRSSFIPDDKRGYWANPNDFIYAGVALAFRLDAFTLSWYYLMESSFISFVIAYLISLVVYIIPFIVIQSFLGQFSSSGYISAFRITPHFKGLGYVALVLNMFVISFYSIFAAVPLVYMFVSMQPTLPWSCEEFKKWATNLTREEGRNLCNVRNASDTDYSDKYIYNHYIPSALYFKTFFNDKNSAELSISWQLILCAILVWTIVTLLILKFFNTERFGQIIRYTIWTLLGLLVVLIIRFSFLPGSGHVHHRFGIPNREDIIRGLLSIPFDGVIALGPGWGLLITLSSFNKFKTNIMKQSCLIGLGQLGIVIGLVLLANFTEKYFKEVTSFNYVSEVGYVWDLYLSAGSVMSHMAWANLWSILYYFMLFLAAMLLIIMNLYTMLTTIFDEFESLRDLKVEVSICLITVAAAISLYFTSNHGIKYLKVFLLDSYISQTSINLLLILIVLWIYGRIRFQRDMEFMINEHLSTWQIYFLRFVAPFEMLLALAIGVFVVFIEHLLFSNVVTAVFALIFIVIPWLLIPGYAVYYMCQGIGINNPSFQRISRPKHWYPVEQEDRQRYDEAIANAAITHPQIEISHNNISTI